MRRIAEMEEVSIKIKKLYKQATKEENWKDADYWESVLDALNGLGIKKAKKPLSMVIIANRLKKQSKMDATIHIKSS